jgi:hypothetical protein
LRLGRRIAENLPEFLDGCIQTVFEVDIGVRRPKALAYLLSRNYHPGTVQQHLQNLVRLAAELQASTVLVQFAGTSVEFVWTKTEFGRGVHGLYHGEALAGILSLHFRAG